LTWQDLQDFVSDRMVVHIPFQYIAGLLETCVSRVLKTVAIPSDGTQVERLGDNQQTIFADTSHVLNEFDLQSLINYCIALKEVFQGQVSPLGFCNFRCC
jgi:hypothetical protein